MIIRKFGVELRRITRADIELIRVQRNRQDIRSRMFEQDLITPEQQERWLASVDNMYNYYFVIHYQGRKIGLIHGKNIDYDRRENEGGLFIWEPSLLGTGVAAKASICFSECCFFLLLSRRVFVRVRPDNQPAWSYNRSLGFVPCPERGEHYLVLTREAYQARAPRLRWLLSGRTDSSPLSVADIEIPDAAAHRYLYEHLPPDILDIIRPRLLQPAGWL